MSQTPKQKKATAWADKLDAWFGKNQTSAKIRSRDRAKEQQKRKQFSKTGGAK